MDERPFLMFVYIYKSHSPFLLPFCFLLVVSKHCYFQLCPFLVTGLVNLTRLIYSFSYALVTRYVSTQDCFTCFLGNFNWIWFPPLLFWGLLITLTNHRIVVAREKETYIRLYLTEKCQLWHRRFRTSNNSWVRARTTTRYMCIYLFLYSCVFYQISIETDIYTKPNIMHF